MHSHYALEIYIALESSFQMDFGNGDNKYQSLIINSNIPHKFSGNNGTCALILINPKHNLANKLSNNILSGDAFKKLDLMPFQDILIKLSNLHEEPLPYENARQLVTGLLKGLIQPIQIDKLAAEFISVGDTPDDCAILYLHGGAYNIGSLNTHRDLAARISKASKIKTLLIDYRLAPEHPHPAAVEDAVLAYRWLLKNGFSPNNIVIAGDSAGGGLAIVALVKLRDLGELIPAAIVCLSPWTDLELTGESIKTHIHNDPFLNPAWLEFMAKHYVANNDPCAPLISPIYANLKNLPPILIQVGSDEILLSDSINLAERAREAGVNITLDVWENIWHVWHFFAGKMPEANSAINQIGNFIHMHLKKGDSIISEKNLCYQN
jgi:acetyl esterase/lipase